MIYKWLLIASRWGLLYPCACLVKAPQYNTVSGCFSVCEMQSVIFLSNYFTYLKKKKVSQLIHLFLCVHTQPQTHTHDVPGRCQIVFTFLRSLEKGEKEESEVNEDLSFIGE